MLGKGFCVIISLGIGTVWIAPTWCARFLAVSGREQIAVVSVIIGNGTAPALVCVLVIPAPRANRAMFLRI